MNTPELQTKKKLTPAQALLQKEVTRKQFMTTVGFTLVSILGFSTIIHFLTGNKGNHSIIASSQRSGYGSSSYGE